MPRLSVTGEERLPFMRIREAPPLDWREPYPVFNRIALETCSACNRRCWFCPRSSGRRKLPGMPMSDELFDSICRQLGEMRWEGFVEMFLLNEPMLDPKILGRVARLRSASPHSTIYLSTNGDKFAASRDSLGLLELVYAAGFNSVNFNSYDSGERGARRLVFYRELIESAVVAGLCEWQKAKYRRVPPSRRAACVTDMGEEALRRANCDVIYDKVAEVRVRLAGKAYCSRPHRHLVINYDGRSPLCCAMDSTHPDAMFVGDTNRQSLLEIWDGEPMAKHRHFLQRGDRAAMRQCRCCHYRMAFPHCVRLTSADEVTVERWRREER